MYNASSLIPFVALFLQVSPRDNRVVPFCNEDGDIPDKTKTFEVDRDRTRYPGTVETEQVRGK